MSSHVTGIDIDVYSAFAVIFNILCLEVAYDSMRLFYWYLLCSRKANFYVTHRN